MRRAGCLLGFIVGSVFLGGFGAPSVASAAPAAPVAIQANDFRFCAASAPLCTPLDSGYTVTVPAGTEVVWTYTDTECDAVVPCPGHNVTFGRTAGKTIKSEGTTLLTRVFTTPGRYDYFCSIHQPFGMTGTIVVQPAAANGVPSASGSPSAPPAPSSARVAAADLPRTGTQVAPAAALATELMALGGLLVALNPPGRGLAQRPVGLGAASWRRRLRRG